jgi:hypothetical protein
LWAAQLVDGEVATCHPGPHAVNAEVRTASSCGRRTWAARCPTPQCLPTGGCWPGPSARG